MIENSAQPGECGGLGVGGGGVHALPLSLYLSSLAKLGCTLS